jgi:hypothetical protein
MFRFKLENLLCRESSLVRFEAQRLLNKWRDACGAYLARIAEKYPDRVSSHRTANARRWAIHPLRNSNEVANRVSWRHS